MCALSFAQLHSDASEQSVTIYAFVACVSHRRRQSTQTFETCGEGEHRYKWESGQLVRFFSGKQGRVLTLISVAYMHQCPAARVRACGRPSSGRPPGARPIQTSFAGAIGELCCQDKRQALHSFRHGCTRHVGVAESGARSAPTERLSARFGCQRRRTGRHSCRTLLNSFALLPYQVAYFGCTARTPPSSPCLGATVDGDRCELTK